MENVENTSKAVKLCNDLTKDCYDGRVSSPVELSSRVMEIKAASSKRRRQKMLDSGKQETIPDIIREMRDLGALDEECADMIPRSLQALGLRTYADRLEAACKRERDPLAKPRLCKSCRHLLPDGCEICGCIEYEAATERDQAPGPSSGTKPGNASALREALENVVKYLGDIIPTRREVELVKSARAALAAPPRNCDIGTAEEQTERFEAFCHGHPNCHCCEVRELYNKCASPFCALAWGHMPYKEGDSE